MELYVKIVPSVFAFLFAVYLACTIFNPDRLKAVLGRHKKDTIGNSLYRKIYTPRFLLGWTSLTLFSIFNLAFDLFGSTHVISESAMSFRFIVSMSLASIGLYLLWSAFKRR